MVQAFLYGHNQIETLDFAAAFFFFWPYRYRRSNSFLPIFPLPTSSFIKQIQTQVQWRPQTEFSSLAEELEV
jgi:hypothetical protein